MSGRAEARWRLRARQSPDARALAAALDVHPITAQVLMNRGIRTPGAGRAFLDPSPGDLQPARAVAGMDAAIVRVARAIRERTPVAVYGDYDADGVTATAILVRAIRAAGGPVSFYVPDRQAEGYGLHAGVVRRLAADAGVILAVDCGITAAADTAREAGVDLIILDHHVPIGPLPHAAVIVNPKVSREPTEYCAAGLAYQLTRGLHEVLNHDLDDADLLGLAAIGTVADAVPLRDANRIIVAQGLEALAATGLPGVKALLEVAALRAPLSARDVSHGVAPRLNAAGRLAHASAAVRLLLSDDPDESRAIAEALDRLNGERRALCDRVLAEALEAIESAAMGGDPAIVVAREGWHPGVIGIVASQIVERYYRPAVVIAIREGVGKGSGRSIPALHLVETLARASSTLDAYGGHAMAAGLTVAADAVSRFREAFVREAGAALSADDLVPVVEVDVEVGLEALTPALADELARIAPCGSGNPEPVLLTRGVRAVGTRTVGNGAHLRLIVSDGVRSADAIGFRLGDHAELLAFTQARLDLAYALERDRWRQEPAVQLVVERLWTPEVDLETVTADTADLVARLFDRADDYLDVDHARPEDVPAFHTKVVGVTFEGRQDLVRSIKAGQRLRLVRDPSNPRDPYAIKVVTPDGGQLGFLRAALAARLAPTIDAGARYEATATALTGGGDRAWGLNIYLERQAPWSGDIEAGTGQVRPPQGEAFLDWVAARLARGRGFSDTQRGVLDAMLSGRRAVVRHGPGRGILLGTAAAAAALLASGAGPALVVLPRAVEVDAWAGALGPWLRAAGLRLVAVHGLLAGRARSRADDALDRRDVDVLVASAAWVLARAPRACAVIAVTDDICPEEDLLALRDVYGAAVRLVWGPASPSRLLMVVGGDRARSAGVTEIVSGSPPRTNLRVVDRRGRRDQEGVVPSGSSRPDKTLVVTCDAGSSVAEARRLRARAAEAAGHVAYYHDHLPAALRRVLEDLYAAGRIQTLVVGSPMVQPAVPLDVNRVVALGLPPTRLLAAETLAAGGAGGQATVIELLYAPDAPAVWAATRAARQPSRDDLVRGYQHLRMLGPDAAWTRSEVLAHAARSGYPVDLLATALEIFLEAGVVSAEGAEGDDVRYTLTDPTVRVDLQKSLRYREAVRERAAFEDLARWATGPASAILTELAQP
ncbi:MAG: single-stranded-DNA-specific exonuclease RecJ [Armatimonadota bacterium]|nr:single-stranded-DNA-specific exonuclease RecJ [Armatimonadota bacterium]